MGTLEILLHCILTHREMHLNPKGWRFESLASIYKFRPTTLHFTSFHFYQLWLSSATKNESCPQTQRTCLSSPIKRQAPWHPWDSLWTHFHPRERLLLPSLTPTQLQGNYFSPGQLDVKCASKETCVGMNLIMVMAHLSSAEEASSSRNEIVNN
jgi:hypothetical protein